MSLNKSQLNTLNGNCFCELCWSKNIYILLSDSLCQRNVKKKKKKESRFFILCGMVTNDKFGNSCRPTVDSRGLNAQGAIIILLVNLRL